MGVQKFQKISLFKRAAFKRTAVLAIFASAVFFVVAPVLAQVNTGIEFGAYTGLADTDIRIIIAKIIRAFLGLLGIIALGFTLYGGWMYMTSEGDENKLTTAKRILKNMAIGLAIILSAFAITQFVINMLRGEYGNEGPGAPPLGGVNYCLDCGFLGSIIESHYPQRNATGIPRNTKIVVTFKYKISPSTLIVDNAADGGNGSGVFGDNIKDPADSSKYLADKINANNFKIFATKAGESTALATTSANIFLASDNRTIVIKPVEFLGSPTEEVNYTVKLGTGIKLEDGRPAFGSIGNGYSWQFTVSTVVDLTPPEITSIIPLPSTERYPRNLMLQFNFNEPVDPISAAGNYRLNDPVNSFTNINLVTSTFSGAPYVNGDFKITNQYYTVEFKTNAQCGVNPCGQPIFCLPENASVTTTVKSPTLDYTNLPQALIGATIYNGIADMAGNGFNGGGELKLDRQLHPGRKTKAEWSVSKDANNTNDLSDFYWNFKTSAEIDLTAPKITAMTPDDAAKPAGEGAEGVSPAAPLTIAFDKLMSMSTFSSIILRTDQPFNVAYTSAGKNYDKDGVEITLLTQTPDKTTSELLHSDFVKLESLAGGAGAIYFPFLSSELNDMNQNCFYPAEKTGTACVPATGGLNTEDASKLTHANQSCFSKIPSSYGKTSNELCPVINITGDVDANCPYKKSPYNYNIK